MKYFTELLESYSRLKKRTLKLLEAEQNNEGPSQEAVAKAKQAINQFNSTVAADPNKPNIKSYPSKNQFRSSPGTYNVRIFSGEDGIKKYQFATSINAIDILPETEMDPGWNKFVSYFETDLSKRFGGEGVGTAAPIEKPSKQKTNLISWWDVTGFASKLKQAVLDRIASKLDSKRKEKFLNYISKAFSGNRAEGSIARMIDENTSIALDDNGNINFEDSEEGADQELKNQVQDTMKKCLDIFSKDKITGSECSFLKQSLVKVKGGQFVVKDAISGGRGLVFNDRSKHIRDLFDTGASIHDCKLNEISMSQLVGGGNLRGNYMEIDAVVAHLAFACADPEKRAKYSNCEGAKEELIQEMINNREGLNKAFQALKAKAEAMDGEFAIPTDDETALAMVELRRIFGDNADVEVVRKIAQMTAYEYRIRRPDFILRVGGTTRGGRRADTLELYETREAAVNAMKRQGFSPEDAESLVKEMDISDICGQDERIGKTCPKDTSRSYYGVNISMKNYLNIDEGISLGTVSENTSKAVLTGRDCPKGEEETCSPEERELINRFRVKAKEHFKLSDLDVRGVKKLEERLSEIDDKIDSLNDANVRVKGGDRISVKQLKTYAKTLSSQIMKDLGYEGATEDGLYRKLQEFYEASEGDPEQLKGLIKCFVRDQELKKITNTPQGRKTVNAHRAMTAFLAGGSTDDSVLSARALQTGEAFVSQQNSMFEMYRDVLEKGDDSEYEIVSSESGRSVTIQHKDENKRKQTGHSMKVSTDVKKSGRLDMKAHASRNLVRSKSRKVIKKRGEEGTTPIAQNSSNEIIKMGITISEMLLKYSKTLKQLED